MLKLLVYCKLTKFYELRKESTKPVSAWYIHVQMKEIKYKFGNTLSKFILEQIHNRFNKVINY
jgi:hypothetical protein